MKQKGYGGVEFHLISSLQWKWNGPHLSMVSHACKCMLVTQVKTLLIVWYRVTTSHKYVNCYQLSQANCREVMGQGAGLWNICSEENVIAGLQNP